MSKTAKMVILMLLACVVIAIVPLMIIKDSEFGGADGEAEDVIAELNPDYEPWIGPILEPPGGETESLLFCIQAALGAGVLGFGMGVLKERKKHREEEAK